MSEKSKRSVVKSLTWRVTATLTTTGLVYFFTGDLEIAATVSVIEVIVKLILYFVHERVWLNIKWGSN